jgi:oligopeptide/dipeptide ABC transporter ATP-binding protein
VSDATNVSDATRADSGERRVILDARHLSKHYPVKGGVLRTTKAHLKAVDDLTFTVYRGETLGVVGESGCGKSTLGRVLLRLEEPTAGEVVFEGDDIVGYDRRRLHALRKDMQFIYQDPYSSMNPKMTIRDIVLEPLENYRKDLTLDEKLGLAGDLLEMVGLTRDVMRRYPHEFSGGQRQRVVIARGIALDPKFVVCDEVVSALDVSVQAQVINLLSDLKRRLSLTYLFISHDLRVIRHVSDRIMVLYLGRVMEIAPVDELFDRPLHPYTKSLMGSISKGDPRNRQERVVLRGEIPSPLDAPKGCPFATRCPIAVDRCAVETPPLEERGDGHMVSCFFA